MDKKTPMYIMMMVGIVAIVAIVYMLTKPTVNTQTPISDLPDVPPAPGPIGISGNVVSDDITPVSGVAIGRFMFGMVLVGTVMYMYKRW